METEQPVAGEEINQGGGQGISEILSNGLKEKADNPEAISQPEESDPNNQPEVVPEKMTQEQQEELFGELLLEDQKKMGFKTKEELQDFIEKNKDLFGKTDHFLRMSDYTRKTQALKQEREQFEQEKLKDDESWGEVKPDDNSMVAFKNLWAVFQNGGTEFQQRINSFMQDIQLLADGKNPVGPLSSSEGGNSSVSPEVISLKRELASLRREVSQGRAHADTEKEQAARDKAETDWKAWKQAKEKEGAKISEELEGAMVPYLQGMAKSDMDNQSKLERALKLASEELGLSGNQAVKKVYADAKKASSRTPASPSFKTPVNQQPAEKTVGGILRQGMQQL